ncbi:MAG: PilZ domain-containing protein [Paenisporosarcina sp.]
MQYNRLEAFRHTFKDPITATFRLIVEGENEADVEISKRGACLIMDLSPSGMRIYSDLSIPKIPGQTVHLAIDVLLNDEPLTLVGNIVWKKAYRDGNSYGIDLKTDKLIEYNIIKELKARRRNELAESKKSKK